MRKNLKKFVVLLLFVFFFTASGFSLKVNAVEVTKNLNLLDRAGTVRETSTVTKVSLKDSALSYKDTDTVRLIIELKGRPIISYATSKGVKVNELDKVTRQNLKKTLQAEQKKFKDLLKSKGISIKELESYINVLNGLGVETTFKNAKRIEVLSEVSSVSIAHEFSRPEPDMINSKDIVKAVETWTNTGYNGEKMVVAIIDTGLDPSHKDFILTDASKAKIQATTFEGFLGTYRTAKVPYGYNYMDNNQEILDLGPDASEHGMHVAGTVGANGDEANGGIKGIAPEAQLLAMKVFGNNPAMHSTFGDVIIKAIDDSVELGADVINMSLGSSASFVQADDLEQVAVKRAMDNGVISAISAGNANLFGSGFDDPFTSNPDVGVVGSPGIATESIQVASIENSYISALALEYMYSGVNSFAPYIPAGTYDPINVFTAPVPYLQAGIGIPEDFAGKDFTGKIALVERGGLDFVTKIQNAQNAGAAGVIIYNHETGGEELISMAYPDGGKIPAVFIARSHGLKLIENIASETNLVSFKGNTAVALNPDAGKMSDFTSWGTTPSLDFKPEITAPGGNIWSTAQNNGYQTMSGTSMAAPHVAGGSALVLQRVADEFSLTGAAKVTMAKNLLMSTAVALQDKGLYNDNYGLGAYNFTSPRRQGAGVMDLFAATTTPAVVYEMTSGESKVSLGEMDNQSKFILTVENFSDEEVTYKIDGTVQTDLTDGEYNYLETQGVYIDGTPNPDGPNGFWSGEYPISFSKDEVTVLANSTVQVEVEVDLTNAVDWWYNAPLKDVFENGTFIEGFVTLEDKNDTYPTLSIPYMGYYGDWDKAPIIDASIYGEGRSFYELTSMAWYEAASDSLYFLGLDAIENPNMDNIAFSPNGNGIADNVLPVLSFLRNAKAFEVNILNENGEVIRALHQQENITKNYYDSGNDSKFTVNLDWMWNGTVDNKMVSEGKYYYQIRSKVDYEGANWQTVNFPVKLDNTKPTIEGVTYDSKTNTLVVTANDSFSGIASYEILDNTKKPVLSVDGAFDLTDTGVTSKAKLVVTDYAGNMVVYELKQILKVENQGVPVGKPADPNIPQPLVIPVKEPKLVLAGDATAPVVKITNPEFFGVYGANQLRVQGTLTDDSPIKSLTLDGKPVTIKWNNQNGYWYFDFMTTYTDGYHSIQVEVIDMAGNAIAFAHKIFVDATKPVITLQETIPTETTLDKITLKALFTDNLPSLMVRLNQNMLTNIEPDWSYFNDLQPASYTMEKEVELKMGPNLFILEGEDDAGNVTKTEVIITRVAP
ncbi:MAG: S8 family serine peptidase [Clostridiaceae bacterium]